MVLKCQLGWGTPVSLRSNLNSENRILIKEGLKLNVTDNDIKVKGYGDNSIIASLREQKIKVVVGDLAKYMNDGIVLIQIKTNSILGH